MLRGMSLLPFDSLPPYRGRGFVPEKIDLGEWREIGPLFDKLEARAPQCRSAAELERWLLDAGELTAALDEELSRRYIAMTCHTDDVEAEKAYLHYVERVEPELKPRQFKLAQIYLGHEARPDLGKERYFVYDRSTKWQVELFRPENVPLETEEAKLSQQYQKLIGSLTVRYRGEEQTLSRMGRYLEETERAVRQEAWELTANRRLQEAEEIEGIFERIAQTARADRRQRGLPQLPAIRLPRPRAV